MLNYAFVLIILNLFIYYAVSGQIRLNCQVMWRKGIAHPNFFLNIGNEYCTCLLKPIVCLPLSTKRFRVAECLSCSFPWNESQWWPQLSNVFKENIRQGIVLFLAFRRLHRVIIYKTVSTKIGCSTTGFNIDDNQLICQLNNQINILEWLMKDHVTRYILKLF